MTEEILALLACSVTLSKGLP